MEIIHIYHTNDVHSHLETIGHELQHFLTKEKSHLQKKGEDFFCLILVTLLTAGTRIRRRPKEREIFPS